MGAFNTPKGYSYNQFADAFARYLTPSEPQDVDDSMLAPENNNPNFGSSQHDKAPNNDDDY